MINLDTFANQPGNSVFAESLQLIRKKPGERYDELRFLQGYLMGTYSSYKITTDEFNVLFYELKSIYYDPSDCKD